MSRVSPFSGGYGSPPPPPPLISRAFFGVTHRVDNLVTWAQDLVFPLRYLKKFHESTPQSSPEALKNIREMLSVDEARNQRVGGKERICHDFYIDAIRSHLVQIGKRKWERPREGQKEKQGEQIVDALEQLVGTEGSIHAQRVLHQGFPGIKWCSYVLDHNSWNPFHTYTEARVQKNDKAVVLSYRVVFEVEKEGLLGTFTYQRTVVVPATEFEKEIPQDVSLEEIMPNATSQEQFFLKRRRFFEEKGFEGPVSRLFRWIFSYTLDPVVQRIQRLFHSTHR